MSDKAMREAFDAWLLSHDDGSGYQLMHAQTSWLAWQAGALTERDALRARVADLTRDAGRYRFWRDCWGDEQFLATLGSAIKRLAQPLVRGDHNNFDIVSDIAIAAEKVTA